MINKWNENKLLNKKDVVGFEKEWESTVLLCFK